nr:hypothetical protein [uncultured Hyphomonas sp.]
MAFAPTGKYLRLPFLYDRTAPIIICPIDDFLIFGPKNGLESPTKKLDIIARAKPDAVLTFCGTLARNPTIFRDVPAIVNLSASTTLSNHTQKSPVHSVELAIKLNAAAVAVHINLASRWASEMISYAGRIVAEASKYDLPTLCISYPRGEGASGDNNFEHLKDDDPEQYADMIAHCVSLGVDLGFDIIKTYYTDDPNSFERVIQAAAGVPIVIAGGKLQAEAEAVAKAHTALAVGAAGVSFGRNVFGRENPSSVIKKIRAWEGKSD